MEFLNGSRGRMSVLFLLKMLDQLFSYSAWVQVKRAIFNLNIPVPSEAIRESMENAVALEERCELHSVAILVFRVCTEDATMDVHNSVLSPNKS